MKSKLLLHEEDQSFRLQCLTYKLVVALGIATPDFVCLEICVVSHVEPWSVASLSCAYSRPLFAKLCFLDMLQARNALKRIAKMPYTLESAEEFEQAYLHLAQLYVERGKFDLAQVKMCGILSQTLLVHRSMFFQRVV